MAKSKEKKVSPKKLAQLDAIQKINSAFPELREAVGTKKFEVRVKKAAKLLVTVLKKSKPVKKDKVVKKVAPKEQAA